MNLVVYLRIIFLDIMQTKILQSTRVLVADF